MIKAAEIKAAEIKAAAVTDAKEVLEVARDVAKRLVHQSQLGQEIPYSNRELDSKFQSVETLIQTIHSQLTTKIDTSSAEILKEVRFTNGKVKLIYKILYPLVAIVGVVIITQPTLLAFVLKALGL